MTARALLLLALALLWYILRGRRRKGCGDALPSRYPFDRCLPCRMPSQGTPDADRLLRAMFED